MYISFEQMCVMNNNGLMKKNLRIMEHTWEELDVAEEITVHKRHTPINNCTVTYIKSRYHRDCRPAERPVLHFLQKQENFTIHESLRIDIGAPNPASCQLLYRPEHETNHSPLLVPTLRKEVPRIDCLHLSIEHSRPLQLSSQSVHATVANDNHSIKFDSDKRFGLVNIAQM